MNQEFLSFGEELRRRRLIAGLSLSKLAESVHYSKGQLSKVERGIKAPSRELARLCDTVLQADGRLTSLSTHRPTSDAKSSRLVRSPFPHSILATLRFPLTSITLT